MALTEETTTRALRTVELRSDRRDWRHTSSQNAAPSGRGYSTANCRTAKSDSRASGAGWPGGGQAPALASSSRHASASSAVLRRVPPGSAGAGAPGTAPLFSRRSTVVVGLVSKSRQ